MNPSIVLQKLENFTVPDRSSISNNAIESLKGIIRGLDTQNKGKTFLWNEKGFVAAIPLVEKKANNYDAEINIDMFNAVSNYYLINGKYDAETIVMLLFLENISSVEDIISNNSVKMAFACSMQSRNKARLLTAIVFSARTK